MKTIRVGKDNSTYQQIVALKENRTKRLKMGLMFVEGIQNIKEAIANHWEIEAFIYSRQTTLSLWAKSILDYAEYNYIIDDFLMKKLCDKTDTCEIMALVRIKKDNRRIYPTNPIFVLLDRPSKKGNLGTIIRSCDAFGVSEIFYSGHSVDLYDPAVITASMGSFFKMPITFIPTNDAFMDVVKKLKVQFPNLKVIGSSLQAKKKIFDCNLGNPVLLLVGNEADGLCYFYNNHADEFVKIPMNDGCDSLNVACATTTCLYEIMRQRCVSTKV